MKKRIASGIVQILLLTNMLTLAIQTQPAEAFDAFGTITISSDGSISPASAPISNVGNAIYRLLDNITYFGNDSAIRIYRDNIILDGNGFSLRGLGDAWGIETGYWAVRFRNVTIENLRIEGFSYGIVVWSSDGGTIRGNEIANITGNAIYAWESNHVSIYENNIADSGCGINLNTSWNVSVSSYNSVFKNNLTNNNMALIAYSSHNSIFENNISSNGNGLDVAGSSNNTIYENKMQSNVNAILLLSSSDCTVVGNNVTDNTYGGIRIENSQNCTLSGNAIESTSTSVNSFDVAGDEVGDFFHSIDASNTVNGKPIYYLKNQTDLSITPLAYPEMGFLALINSTRIKIEGLNLTNRQGILLAYANDSMVLDNSIKNGGYGLKLVYSSNTTLSGNTIISNYFGIEIFSSNNTLSGNYLANNKYGIVIASASEIVLRNNVMVGNERNFGVGGTELSHYMNDIDASNTVNGKPIYYLVNQQNLVVEPHTFPNLGFLAVVNSSNAIIQDLTFEDNYEGALLAYSENALLQNVNASSNEVGIMFDHSSGNIESSKNIVGNAVGILFINSSNSYVYESSITTNDFAICLQYSSNNSISRNNVVQNHYYGIYLFNSANNSIFENQIVENYYVGICIYQSSDNRIFHNNFVNNAQKVLLGGDTGNVWDDGYPSGGNYWSDYTGADTNGDGIGDAPYVIDASNQDNYPLMSRYPQGDVNHDGIVDEDDLELYAQSYGSTVGDPYFHPDADLNKDEEIDILDLRILGRNYRASQSMEHNTIQDPVAAIDLCPFAMLFTLAAVSAKKRAG